MTLNIAGWSKMSTVDWPGEIVATLFLQGCPLRCNYCHNSAILDPSVRGEVSFEDDVLPLLKQRLGLLDGVVFSGGEPTMQASGEDGGELLKAIKAVEEIREGGVSESVGGAKFKIGLHTSGIYPENLKAIIKHIDWVGFDVKANTGLYDAITNVKGSEANCRKSLNFLLEEREFRKNSSRPLNIQFRTTVDPTVMTDKDVKKLKAELAEKGITDLVLQEVRTEGAPEGYDKRLAAVLSGEKQPKDFGSEFLGLQTSEITVVG